MEYNTAKGNTMVFLYRQERKEMKKVVGVNLQEFQDGVVM
jgi:hypothetical protein